MAKKKSFEQAGDELNKFFSQQDEQGSKAFQTIAGEDHVAAQEAPKKAQNKPQNGKKERKIDVQKVFSFRAHKDTVDSWRVWADAKGIKVDELGENAITEYIKRHSLTSEQQQIYDLKMAQKKS